MTSDVFLNNGNFGTVFGELLNYLLCLHSSCSPQLGFAESCGGRVRLPAVGCIAVGLYKHLKKPKVLHGLFAVSTCEKLPDFHLKIIALQKQEFLKQ